MSGVLCGKHTEVSAADNVNSLLFSENSIATFSSASHVITCRSCFRNCCQTCHSVQGTGGQFISHSNSSISTIRRFSSMRKMGVMCSYSSLVFVNQTTADRGLNHKSFSNGPYLTPCESTGARGLTTRQMVQTQRKQKHADNIAWLIQEGFSNSEATRFLRLRSAGALLNQSHALSWLETLKELKVDNPTAAMASCPVILDTTPFTLQTNSVTMLAWMKSLGMSSDQIRAVVSKWPKLLATNSTSITATATWFKHSFDWETSNIVQALSKNPAMFSVTPATLEKKVVWFKTVGLTQQKLSVVLSRLPALLTCSVHRNQAQLASLQAMGLSKLDVFKMVRLHPALFCYNLGGGIMQAKLRFLTHVMGRLPQEVVTFPCFFSYSLCQRIGPRWEFFTKYAPGSTFNLSSRLTPTDMVFAKQFPSPLLDAECALRKTNRLQIFQEYLAAWRERDRSEVLDKGQRQWWAIGRSLDYWSSSCQMRTV